MATFHIHEDSSSNKENVKPKFAMGIHNRKTGDCRSVLQPLKNHIVLQNVKPFNNISSVAPFTTKTINQNQNEKAEGCDMPTATTTSIIPFETSSVIHRSNVLNEIPRNLGLGSCEKEYEEDIWTYLLKLEKTKIHKIRPMYMSKQDHLNWEMRSVLIDWIVSVASEYNMSNQTIHLGITYLDRFLSNLSVIREKFQLVGATAMIIAGKFHEIYPPEISEWAYLTGDAFTVHQILKMEQLMLRVLEFDMQSPTILEFIKRFYVKHQIDKKTMYLAMYLSELVLLEGKDYLKHLPSKLAAAAVALARHTLFKRDLWSKKMEDSVGYTLKQLSPVVQKQQKTFKSSPFKQQQAIQKKYASEKYQRVALVKPRLLILDDIEDEE